MPVPTVLQAPPPLAEVSIPAISRTRRWEPLLIRLFRRLDENLAEF